jgi:hypothetical protein
MFRISDNSDNADAYPAGIASDGDSYLVGYVSQSVSHATLGLARVDDHGVVTRGGTLTNVGNVSIAWGGPAYVVGYVDAASATVAAVVASDGTVLRSGIPIVIGAGDVQSFRVSPGANGSVIATWSGKDRRVHAVMVRTAALIDGTYAAQASGEGAPVLGELPSPASGASNGTQTLVVWTEAIYPVQPVGFVSVTIRARRLDASGNPAGDPIVVAHLNPSSSSVDFSVAWNGSVFVVGYAWWFGAARSGRQRRRGRPRDAAGRVFA